MDVITYGYVFVLGTIIGSFLNVVLFRAYTGRGLHGRSSCGSCGRTLGVIDLVPVLSFLGLRGRCRTCGSKISWQYPLVELITGILFLLSYLHAKNMYELMCLIVISVLVVLISVYDIRHTVIPDAWSYAFSAAAIGYRLPEVIAGTTTIGNVVFAGLCMSAGVYAIWFLSQGRWIGFGDVKLIFGIGALLGVFGAVMVLWLSCILGSLVGVVLIVTQKVRSRGMHITLGTQIAFGPFMLVSTLIFLFEYISLTYLWNMLYIV